MTKTSAALLQYINPFKSSNAFSDCGGGERIFLLPLTVTIDLAAEAQVQERVGTVVVWQEKEGTGST
eukprot:409167-Pelagomonas_calceolata.AAC.1